MRGLSLVLIKEGFFVTRIAWTRTEEYLYWPSLLLEFKANLLGKLKDPPNTKHSQLLELNNNMLEKE